MASLAGVLVVAGVLVTSGTFGWCFCTLWSLVAFMVRLFTTHYGLCGMPFE